MLMRYMSMTPKKSSATQTTGASAPVASSAVAPAPRIPVPYKGYQYNACKNPNCAQYGVPAPEEAKRAVKGPYAIVGGGKGYPLLKCNCCGETPPLKSNFGIGEEFERLVSYLREEEVFCPNDDPDASGKVCPNHAGKVPVGTKKAYQSYGTNAHGSKRVRCNCCEKVFLIGGKPAKGQHETHNNREIFNSLVNKVALSRIVKMHDVSWAVLYNRIDFIYEQCKAFVARRERKLKTLPIERLYVAIDSQDYLVNWTERSDKRNVVLKGLTAVDNKTGYVFCNALNFDETADREAIEADAEAINDAALPAPHRKYARVWTAGDYEVSVKASAAKPKLPPAGSLLSDISNGYAAAGQRDDIERFDEKRKEQKLPDYGVQVHSEYTMIAMFLQLKYMVGNCEKWRFFMDQESGIRAACLSAFSKEIKQRSAEAFYVRIEKELTQDKKRHCMNDAKKAFKQYQNANPGLDDDEIRLLMIKDEIAFFKNIGTFGDKWINMPLPSMSEPKKAVCWLTEHADYDPDHTAWLYNKASLHSVDSYFMKSRRSIAMCERSIHSAANAGRTWGAYQVFNPAVLKKVLEIYRVYSNYCDVPLGVKKDERKTPAMRLGLADAVLDFNDILYFK